MSRGMRKMRGGAAKALSVLLSATLLLSTPFPAGAAAQGDSSATGTATTAADKTATSTDGTTENTDGTDAGGAEGAAKTAPSAVRSAFAVTNSSSSK